jgi:hypothetical protein
MSYPGWVKKTRVVMKLGRNVSYNVPFVITCLGWKPVAVSPDFQHIANGERNRGEFKEDRVLSVLPEYMVNYCEGINVISEGGLNETRRLKLARCYSQYQFLRHLKS